MVICIEREEKEGKKSPFFLPPYNPPLPFPKLRRFFEQSTAYSFPENRSLKTAPFLVGFQPALERAVFRFIFYPDVFVLHFINHLVPSLGNLF